MRVAPLNWGRIRKSKKITLIKKYKGIKLSKDPNIASMLINKE
jgi:hypothetical protein